MTRRLSLRSEEQLCCFNKSSPCDKNKATSLATQQVIFRKTFIWFCTFQVYLHFWPNSRPAVYNSNRSNETNTFEPITCKLPKTNWRKTLANWKFYLFWLDIWLNMAKSVLEIMLAWFVICISIEIFVFKCCRACSWKDIPVAILFRQIFRYFGIVQCRVVNVNSIFLLSSSLYAS